MESLWQFRLKRAKNMARVILKSKMAVAGVFILVLYTFMAVAATPVTSWITGIPGVDPQDTVVSGALAPPVWYTYLAEGARLSQNLALEPRPSFYSDPFSQGWQFTSPGNTLNAAFDPGTNSLGSGGSIRVSLDKASSPQPGDYSGRLEKVFTWPYKGPPYKFTASVAVLTPTASSAEPVSVTVYVRNLSTGSTYNLTDNTPTSPTNSNPTWGKFYPFVNASSTLWQVPSIDSRGATVRNILQSDLDPASLLFSGSGQFAYGVQITLTSALSSQNSLSVFFDQLNIKLYGTSWGLMGTDYVGRDVFTQVLYGARISLLIGLLSAAVGIIVGLVVGLAAGYMGKLVDEVLMRFTDMLLVLPTLPLLIVLVAVTGGRSAIPILILLIGLLGWMGFARVVRSQVLTLKERPFVEAAKAAGAGTGHITTKHIIPNIVGLIYVNLALSVPGAILTEAALSFLGLGDITAISWGRMLNFIEENQAQTAWWWVLPPGLSIALVSLSFVMIGFALDAVFNPRLRQRR